MTKAELLQKLDGMFDDLERNRAWGNIEIEVREGVPNMVRRTINEKLTQENTRERASYRK
jgi:hypothetical protein